MNNPSIIPHAVEPEPATRNCPARLPSPAWKARMDLVRSYSSLNPPNMNRPSTDADPESLKCEESLGETGLACSRSDDLVQCCTPWPVRCMDAIGELVTPERTPE